MIDLYTDYDAREIAAIIAEDIDVDEKTKIETLPVIAVTKTEEEKRREFERAMIEYCDEEVERAKARMFGYSWRIKEKSSNHVPYKPEPRPESPPEPIGDFMSKLLRRYGVDPTGMTAIQGAAAYRKVPDHIKLRVHAEMRKNRLDNQGSKP